MTKLTNVINVTEFVAPQNVDEARTVFNGIKNHQDFVKKEADKAISLLNKGESSVHVALILTAIHFQAFEDCSIFTRIYNGVKRSHQSAIKQWIETFTPAVLRDTKNGKSFRVDTSDNAQEFNLGAGNENPWYDIKQRTEEEVQALLGLGTVDGKLSRILKDIEKNLDNDTIEEGEERSLMLRAAGIKELLNMTAANTDTEVETTNVTEVEPEAKAA